MQKWIKDTHRDPKNKLGIRPRPNQLGLYQMSFLRNFSSRPPLESFGETQEKIWTHEPLIDFLSDLIKSGIQKKENFDPQNQDHIFVDGCIHISLHLPYPMHGHSILFCQNGDNNYIVDLQKSQYATKVNFNRGLIGPDKKILNEYLSSFSPNSFSIYTKQHDKYTHNNNILMSKLLDVSINNELNNLAGEKMIPDLNDLPLSELPNRISFAMLKLHSKITPAILANPYQLIDEPLDPIVPPPDDTLSPRSKTTAILLKHKMDSMEKIIGSQSEQNKKWLTPLIFHFNETAPWPDSVKEKAQKYSKFQDNTYTTRIRQTALTSILNGKNNKMLDDMLSAELNNIPSSLEDNV